LDGGSERSRPGRKRLAQAEEVCRKILVGPGPAVLDLLDAAALRTRGTVRIGTHVDTDLATPVRNLHVCDASVFPEALDRPTVLTIIALGKRLAKRLAPDPRP
jgi:choline dehydrogenase-like flavoprotein